MAVILPFRAIRPCNKYVSQVASLPYDVMSKEEARKKVTGNPFSFLHVEKSEIDVPDIIKEGDPVIYETAKQNFYKMRKEGIFQQDEEPLFYIYSQKSPTHVQTGIVALVSADEYESGKIKKHEYTRKNKEEDRIRHIDYVNAQTGPVFITYHFKKSINEIVQNVTTSRPVYDFIADDGVAHTVWAVDDAEQIKKIEQEFLSIDDLYIADGHHRAAAAAEVARIRRIKDGNSMAEIREYNMIMSVLFPHDQLNVMDYNRVVRDLKGLTKDKFLEKVKNKFIISENYTEKKPQRIHDFGMYLAGKWYKLTAKEDIFDKNNPVESLDASILQSNILGSVLGIIDPRTDERIKFIGGIRGMAELEKLVDRNYAVAFSLYPVSVEQIMRVADAGEMMPPKSTWFEPKLRSGLFIHELD
ncbi:MAG TPA: DUF1015 domain-containing protein [Deltaproteobacteria bacterium]|nr:DUF1015 domain-containing protein [Deltaproteobacteria bacterium]